MQVGVLCKQHICPVCATTSGFYAQFCINAQHKTSNSSKRKTWQTPPQPTRIVSPRRRTRILPIIKKKKERKEISWRDKETKLVKKEKSLQSSHISRQAVRSIKQHHTLPPPPPPKKNLLGKVANQLRTTLMRKVGLPSANHPHWAHGPSTHLWPQLEIRRGGGVTNRTNDDHRRWLPVYLTLLSTSAAWELFCFFRPRNRAGERGGIRGQGYLPFRWRVLGCWGGRGGGEQPELPRRIYIYIKKKKNDNQRTAALLDAGEMFVF